MTQCPNCKQPLQRVRRKPIERTISYVLPVHRFICYNHACRWQGLRIIRDAFPWLEDKNVAVKRQKEST